MVAEHEGNTYYFCRTACREAFVASPTEYMTSHGHTSELQGINPRLVAERLWHSGVAITLDRYSHVLPSMQAMVADKLDEVFGT